MKYLQKISVFMVCKLHFMLQSPKIHWSNFDRQAFMISVNTIPDPFKTSNQFYFVLINAEGFYITANPCFLNKFGLDPKNLQSIHSYESIIPEDHPACIKAVGLCQHNPGKPVMVDLRKPDKKGGVYFTRWEFTLLPNGDRIMIQCIGYDVSEVAAIKQNNDQMGLQVMSVTEMNEQILANSIDVFLLVNEKRQITYCSPNVQKKLGYTSEELIGQSGFSFLHPDDLVAALRVFEQEITTPGENDSIDLRFKHKDGSWKWIEAKGRNLFNNQHIQSMLLSLHDISSRKEYERALAESELRYKSFFNHLPVPLLLISNHDFQILDVNDHAIEKYGYTKKEFAQLTLKQLFQKEVTAAELDSYYNSGETVIHQTKNRQTLLVKIEKRNIEFAEANGYVIMLTDVTEANHIQQENELGYEVSEILIQPRSLDVNLKSALNRIRSFTGWDLAEMWTPDEEQTLIKRESVDYSSGVYNKQIGHFLNLTSSFDFQAKGYDPTYVESLKPLWIEKLSENEFDFKRKKIAESCGFQSCLILPVLSDQKLICLFSFFSFEERHSNRSEINLLAILGKLFGAEIEKRKNSMMLDMFFQISNDILTIAGLDGRYKQVNPAFEQFIGYTNEEAKKIHPLSYVFDEDKPLVLQQLQELSNGISVPYFENRVVTKGGDLKWIAWTATPLLKEGIVIASHRDITAQKKAAEELKITNERYELIRNATNEAIWDLNILTGEVTMNQGYKMLFGHDFDDVKGDGDFWASNIHPDEREEVVRSFEDFMLQKATTNWEKEYRFRKNDGSYINVYDRGYLIFNDAQQAVRVIGAMTDITVRKNLEQKLILKERNKQNQIAQAVVFAQEKERAEIGKELHDNVGQLLTTTKLYIEMLKHKLDDPLDLIERGTTHINSVIHIIRNLSRSLVPSSIKDLGLLASVNDLIENIQALESIEVEYHSVPELEEKMSEALKLTLYRIIQEQLNNIVRHAEASKVIIELYEEDETVNLLMTDNGKGFNQNTVKKGLGLSNIKSRTELLNGAVDIITTPQQGCKIIIQIPIIH